MARRAKLTQEMADEAIRLKADGLSNGDIICVLGIHKSTFKRTLLTTIRSVALARNQYRTAAAWLLERKYPDEFGKAERKSDEGREDAAPRIVLGVVAQPVQERLPGLGGDGSNG